MSLFDVISSWAVPSSREKLLAICEKKIACGENQKAISIAMKYMKRRINSVSQSLEQKEQKDLDMGFSYFIIGKALYNSIKVDPKFRTYNYFKGFFQAHFHVYGVFQEFPPESKYFSFFNQINSFYDELYESYRNNTELERADIDANDEISKIRRSISF